MSAGDRLWITLPDGHLITAELRGGPIFRLIRDAGDGPAAEYLKPVNDREYLYHREYRG